MTTVLQRPPNLIQRPAGTGREVRALGHHVSHLARQDNRPVLLCARGIRVLDERRGNPPDQAENRGARTPSVLLTLHNPIRNMDSMPNGVPEAAELKDETRALPSADKSSTRP